MKKISLFISFIGILVLLIFINIQNPKISTINSLSINDLNQKVAVQGKIMDARIYKNNFTVAKLKDSSGVIEIICNCPQIKNLTNSTILVIGKISNYQDSIQIQADKISGQ